MDSAFIHQAANELVQNAGTRNIKQIARSCSLDISETSRIKDMLGLLSLYFDKPLILINRQLDKQTKQMVCGYALGHYLEHQLLMDLHTLDKFLTIKDKHILLYEHILKLSCSFFHYSPCILYCTTTSLYTDCSSNLYAGSPSYLLILFSALSAFAVVG